MENPKPGRVLCLRVEALALGTVVLFRFGPTAGATVPAAPAVVVFVVTKRVRAEFWLLARAIAFEIFKEWIQALCGK